MTMPTSHHLPYGRNLINESKKHSSGKVLPVGEEALEIINKVRNRARLKDLDLTAESATEEEMLQAVLHERNIEFAAEGKDGYDLVRFFGENEKLQI